MDFETITNMLMDEIIIYIYRYNVDLDMFFRYFSINPKQEITF